MNASVVSTLAPSNAEWPAKLAVRLGKAAPYKLHAIGPIALLVAHKIAFFCFSGTPGSVILRAHDIAQQLRDEGATVISGFHSPIENDCLGILLRGKQPIIICLARAMEKIRIPSAWRTAIEADRLLMLSPFEKRPRRPTVESAWQRNELVAALSDEVLIIHATPGGGIERISELIKRWGLPVRTLD